MKYKLRFFTYAQEKEEEILLETKKYESLPIIPRKKDVVSLSLDNEIYEVLKVAISYEDNKNNLGYQLIDIMLKIIDAEKEWWE